MSILVTGGAGYIGSHVVKLLGERGENIIVVDNLSTGRRENLLYGQLAVGDVGDEIFVKQVIAQYGVQAVIHFAGSIVVPESVIDPVKYYQNNTVNSLKLMNICKEMGVNNFIFSSTAAVFGETELPVTEGSTLAPASPYGKSKLMTEWCLADLAHAFSNFRYVALRYFNVAGADPDGRIGQSTPNATHLIKVASQVVLGQRKELALYGTDYPTRDGSCIRDYIHVSDLASAHLLALDYLRAGGKSDIFNCGYGHGFTVSEVIKAVKEVSGVNFKVNTVGRRAGDVASLVTKIDKITSILKFKPKYDDLNFIVKSALNWERKLLQERG